MNENEIKAILKDCDLALSPSPALENRCSALTAPDAPKTAVPRRRARLALAAAAIALCAVFMMSAGYRVFEYIFFRPGAGIVTDDGSLVISALTSAVKLNSSAWIEACSLENNGDGSCLLTVITNENCAWAKYDDTQNHYLTAVCGDESYRLSFKSGSTNLTSYVCESFPESNEFTIGDAAIALTPIDKTKFATVKYPVSHGVTLVVFPLSEGSSMLAYTTAYTPEDDGSVLPELTALSERASAELCISGVPSSPRLVITDVNGATYYATGYSASWRSDPVNDAGYLNGQHIISLDRRLEADIASISTDKMLLEFYRPALNAPVSLTVPQLGETTPLDVVTLDALGFCDAPASMSYGYYPEIKRNGTSVNLFSLDFTGGVTCDIPFVREAHALYALYTASEYQDPNYNSPFFCGMNVGHGSVSDENGFTAERSYHKDCEIDDTLFTSGDTIDVVLHSLVLELIGEWRISFE